MISPEFMNPKVFVLGNSYFRELEKLYDVKYASQSILIEKIGAFSDIRDYFTLIDFQPDLLLITDESLPPMYSGLEKLDIPLVGYLIDSHLHYEWHRYFAKIFDHCFVAQKNYFHKINLGADSCSLLPLFAPEDLFLNITRDIDICFVGTLDAGKNPERVRFIDEFKKNIPLIVFQGAYKELFNRSRIILNQSVSDDINFRVFEAMACGGMLLTDSTDNGLEEMFNSGIHLVIYQKGNVSDAINKATYYLANEFERQSIAQAGHIETVSRHTSHSRMHSVNKVLQKLLENHEMPKASRKAALKETYSVLASIYVGVLGDKTLSESYNLLSESL